MINGAKPSELDINIEVLPFFSAAMSASGISPVTRLNVSGFGRNTHARLEVSIVGKCGDNEFIQMSDFVRECFCPDNYNLKAPGSCAFDFSGDCFTFDNAYLSSLRSEKLGEIFVRVCYGEAEACAKTRVRVLPFDTWQGLDGESACIASFVLPENTHISHIVSQIEQSCMADYNRFAPSVLLQGITGIYKAIKECNIIYSRPAAYITDAFQSLRLPDEMFSGSSALATPLELTLLFDACAEKCGYDANVLFVKSASGVVNVLCGVWLRKSPMKYAVSEDSELLSEYIRCKELLVVDPSVFAAAQNTSFTLACENAAQSVTDGSLTLMCMIDISAARHSGVRPMFSFGKHETPMQAVPAKNAVNALYSSLKNTPVMKMLAGTQSGRFTEIPLLLTDFDKYFEDGNNEYRLLPLELNVHLEDFATLDVGFSSVITSRSAGQKFSFSERDAMKARFERFKKSIEVPGCVTSSLCEEKLYNSASHIVFSKNGETAYTVFGYMKITDKLTELVSYAPVCLVPTRVSYNNGVFSVRQTSFPIANKVIIRNALHNAGLAYDSFMKANLPTDKKEIFDLFENIRTALDSADDRHTYEIIKEAHIILCDLSDYILWRDTALCRSKLSESETAACIFGKTPESVDSDVNYYPPLELSGQALGCVRANCDAVLTGAFSEPKLDTVSACVSRAVAQGKTVLVVAGDNESAGYVSDRLGRDGLSDCILFANEKLAGQAAFERTVMLLEKYKDTGENNVAEMPKDLDLASSKINDYSKKLGEVHKMGMSLQEAVSSYFSANENVQNVPAIPIDENVLENADEEKLDTLFNDAGTLITMSRRLCESSGLEPYSPIKTHPLFSTHPSRQLTDEQNRRVGELVAQICPVLSEFRDTFADVSGILGIEPNEVKTLEGAVALNELYKLVLSAREVDIPEDFIESDIELFSQNVNRLSAMKKRREAIEFKLGFFSPEIFEDIETLLPGNNYEDSEKGFLKKFIHKKNGQDTLLQYVTSENRAAFMQKPTDEIYKLLYEYKAYVRARRLDENVPVSLADSYKLAEIASKAGEYIDTITGADSSGHNKRLSGVFRLITIIPTDASLARSMNSARARLAGLYSGDDALLPKLSELMGIDFDSLRFENGVFAFDGLSLYLRNIDAKLDVADKWIKWRENANRIRKTLSGFVDYIEEHGAVGNIDRIFAKSLLLPVAKRISRDTFTKEELDAVTLAKDKYHGLYMRSLSISAENTRVAYSQGVRHCAQTCDVKSLEKYASDGLRTYLEHCRNVALKVMPCTVVSSSYLTSAIPTSYVYDLVIVLDNADMGYKMLPAVSFAKRTLLCNMSPKSQSRMCGRMVKNGVPVFDAAQYVTDKNVKLFSWINSSSFNEKLSLVSAAQDSNAELIRISGTYDRLHRRVNKTEAELMLTKTSEILSQNHDSRVAVTAFTDEMCEYTQRYSFVLARKNVQLSRALAEDRIIFCTPDKLWYNDYDSLVVSSVFGTDRQNGVCRDFGNASSTDARTASDTYISLADKRFARMCFVTSMGANDSHLLRCNTNSGREFDSFAGFLSDGRIPVCMAKNDINDETSFIPGLMSAVGASQSKMIPCGGKTSVGAQLLCLDKDARLAVFVDNDSAMSMHDELAVKSALENLGFETMSISPAEFEKDGFSSIAEALRTQKA